MPVFTKGGLASGICVLQLLSFTPRAHSADTRNLTGLPAYPNLSSCRHGRGISNRYTWPLVHAILGRYLGFARCRSRPGTEKALIGSSEIDLTHDKTYKNFAGVVGVKIVLGIDYVVVYKTNSQAPTSIDLYRCSAAQKLAELELDTAISEPPARVTIRQVVATDEVVRR